MSYHHISLNSYAKIFEFKLTEKFVTDTHKKISTRFNLKLKNKFANNQLIRN